MTLDAYAPPPLVGTVLVEASAGTGKTFTIAHLFLRLLLEARAPLESILVVTFTEAATAELRERVRRRLRDALRAIDAPDRVSDRALGALLASTPDRAEAKRTLARALADFDRAVITTLHGFCQRVLEEHAFESGARFGAEVLDDVAPIERDVAADAWVRALVPLSPEIVRRATTKGSKDERRFTFEAAEDVVRSFARHPDARALPDPPPPDLAIAIATFVALRDEARAAWRRDGADVAALLRASKTLARRKGQWREDAIDAHCLALAAALDVEPLALTGEHADAIGRFAQAEIANATKAHQAPPVHPLFGLCERLHAAALHLEAARDGLPVRLKLEVRPYATRELPARLSAIGARSFDELLHEVDRALASPRGERLAAALRARFSAALIDELQDTDPVQYRIFRRVFHGHAPLVLVGDPKQSIYGFRGADVFAFFAAREDATTRHALPVNHRSDPSLVAGVTRLFAVRAPFVQPQIGLAQVTAHAPRDRLAGGGVSSGIEILFLPRDAPEAPPIAAREARARLPGLVAAEIARLLSRDRGVTIDGEPISPSDVAVLTRTNREAHEVQAALRALRVPTALEGDVSVFQSPEAYDMEHIVRAIASPSRATAVKTALATAPLGFDARALLTLDADERAWEREAADFRRWHEAWLARGFFQAFRKMMHDRDVEARLLALVDGERRLTNLLHVAELLHRAAARERLGVTGLVRWLSLVRHDDETAKLGAEATQLRLESDDRAVKLLTVHKSKGLEYPIVYCPYLWDAHLRVGTESVRFHDRGRLTIDLAASEASKRAAKHEVAAENQRLLYVALTRARHRCSIVWGAIREAEASSLAYVLHQDGARDLDDGALRDATCARVKTLRDAAMRAELEAIARASGGTITVRDLVSAPAPAWTEAQTPPELRARRFARAVDRAWRVGSFSALVAGEESDAAAHEDEARDRDEADDAPPPPPPPPPPKRDAPPVPLHDFPRGTRAGTMIHALLERLDFARADAEAIARAADEALRRFGYPIDPWRGALSAAVGEVLDTPLAPLAFTLRDVARDRRVDELEFVLPAATRAAPLDAARLAAVFARHRSGAVPGAYVDRLRRLRFVPMHGFLRGFVDLVFERDGRFYVVDYKSNHLGDAAEDYGAAPIAAAMAHAHYFLQYHLYVVAVHRWLGRRLPGYDYDAAFGGVLYLFLRGMSPRHAAGRGVFFDRPSRALVEALSAILDGGAAGETSDTRETSEARDG